MMACERDTIMKLDPWWIASLCIAVGYGLGVWLVPILWQKWDELVFAWRRRHRL